MTDTLPWYGYLSIGLLGLFVLFFVFMFLYAFLEGWWLSRQEVPTRFKRVRREAEFDESALPAIAEQLNMTQIDTMPHDLRETILRPLLGNWKGAKFRHILFQEHPDGVFVLCNVRKAEEIFAPDTSGEDKSKDWWEIGTTTITMFLKSEEPYLPEFSTRPFIDYLIVKLSRLLGRKWCGYPRFNNDPEFHDKLLISAAQPENVRPILTNRVRQVLKENCDLTTSIRGRVIVVYSDGHPVKHMMRRGPEQGEIIEDCKILEANEWPEFFEAGRAIINSLRQSVEES